MDLTDSFTWEDLPTREGDTGQLTAAGWIPLIKTYNMRAAVTTVVFIPSSQHYVSWQTTKQ